MRVTDEVERDQSVTVGARCMSGHNSRGAIEACPVIRLSCTRT